MPEMWLLVILPFIFFLKLHRLIQVLPLFCMPDHSITTQTSSSATTVFMSSLLPGKTIHYSTLFKNCLIWLSRSEFSANLLLFNMFEFDNIMGMN